MFACFQQSCASCRVIIFGIFQSVLARVSRHLSNAQRESRVKKSKRLGPPAIEGDFGRQFTRCVPDFGYRHHGSGFSNSRNAAARPQAG